jgi:hypothetical protein
MIEADLGHNGRHTFQSFDEVEAWVSEEEAFWSFIPQGQSEDFERNYRAAWRDIRQRVEVARARSTENHWGSLLAELTSRFARDGYLCRARPEAVFLKNLAADPDRQIVVGAMAALLRWRQHVSSTGLGNTRALLYQLGISPDAAVAAKDALDRIAVDANRQLVAADTQHRSLLDGSQERLTAAVAAWDEARGKANQELVAAIKNLEDERERARTESDEVVAKARERLQAIEKTYEEFMRLKSPVQYWSDRRKRYARRSICWGVAMTVFSVLGFLGLQEVAARLLKPATQGGAAGTQGLQAGPLEIGSALLLVMLFLWGLRILARVLLGSIHLEMDAGERGVMAETYLALSKEEHLKEERDRQLVLAALFRPSSTGVVKDDAAPSTWMDILSRIASGKP